MQRYYHIILLVLLLPCCLQQKDSGLLAAEAIPFIEFKGHTGHPGEVGDGYGGVYSASFSPDGKTIVTTGLDKTVRIWDAESGKELQKWEIKKWEIKSLSYRLFGKTLDDLISTIFFHDIIPPSTSGVLSAKYSPDGTKIAVVQQDATIRIHDADTGKELQKIVRQAHWARGIDFSADGKKVVTPSDNGNAQIFDVESGRCLYELIWHSKGRLSASLLNYAVFSPDGKKIATSSAEETVRIWHADSKKELLVLDSGKEWHQKEEGKIVEVYSVAFSPDGKKLAAAGQYGIAIIWDSETGQMLQRLEIGKELAHTISFSPDGKKILTVSIPEVAPFGHIARMWDTQSGEVLLKLKRDGVVTGASFSPDGRKILTSDWRAPRIWILE